MRRAKSISVVVKAPSRGLVTRLPSLSADLLPTQSVEIQGTLLSSAAFQRASAVAQNVRYEDGVVCTAPGYSRVTLSSALLQSFIAYWPLQEASGTRYDASSDHYDLTDVPGTAPGVPDILSDGGIIGLAAVFPPMPPWGEAQDSLQGDSALAGIFVSPLVLRAHDLLAADSALAGGYINPLPENLPNDLWMLDSSLALGAMTLTVVTFSAPGDSVSADTAAQSGVYTLTVMVSDSPSDSMSLDTALMSGAYTLVTVVSSSPNDSASLDSALVSGEYTEASVGPMSVSDDFSLNSTLLSGSYG